MTVSIRRMSLGAGYAYLMSSVARGDAGITGRTPLTRYYAETGTPPGRFLGAGCSGLNDGVGVAIGSVVSEQMLFNMLGMCADPITGNALGRSPNRWPGDGSDERRRVLPVAGFDLTFSVPKSISIAWALSDAATQAAIYSAHREAIDVTIAYAERQTFFSRSGTNGIVQEPIKGVVATAFDHWDSRAGDPQLHTHVVVSNRVQTMDGTWRTLDSRGLFKQVVTLSEMHQGILSDLLANQIGYTFDARGRVHSDRPKWEISGVPDGLIAKFSQRSHQIDTAKDSAIESFRAEHGREPTSVEVIRLRQRSTIATRPLKEHASLADQMTNWQRRASEVIGAGVSTWASSLAIEHDQLRLGRGSLDTASMSALIEAVATQVAARRATFTQANVLAEAHRALHGLRFITPDDRIAVAEDITQSVTSRAVLISAPDLNHVPKAFCRPDGTSKFRGVGSAVYTTARQLEAERSLLNAARDETGPRLASDLVGHLLAPIRMDRAAVLSADQRAVVQQIATSGRKLDLLVGPAGTGKSTTMRALRNVWVAHYGQGSVVGLAPSATSAEVLADGLGTASENTAKWLYEASRNGDRTAEIDRLNEKLSRVDIATQRAMEQRIADLTSELNRWTFTADQLVIVDEASLGGTLVLQELMTQVHKAGAKLLLVGDWAQLGAVEAGGAFDLLVRDRESPPELSEVRRLVHEWERRASVALRQGNPASIAAYIANGRVASGTSTGVVDAAYSGWRTDTDAGLTSLMIAPDRATVADLNRRAQAERIASGDVNAQRGAGCADGLIHVGDLVVTRQNQRQLVTGRHGWVKNGDLWTVVAIAKNGGLDVSRPSGSGAIHLPADYVREYVELGYASTVHRAQGRTVDTAHAVVSPTTTREALYVAATRGRSANHLYVDVAFDPQPDTSHGPSSDTSAEEVLVGILARSGVDVSAHVTMARELDEMSSLNRLVAEYRTIAELAQAGHWKDVLAQTGLTQDQLDGLTQSDSWGPLTSDLAEADSFGTDLVPGLRELIASRETASAGDLASVLHHRLDRWTSALRATDRPALLIGGFVPEATHVSDPDLQRALRERAAAIERLIEDGASPPADSRRSQDQVIAYDEALLVAEQQVVATDL